MEQKLSERIDTSQSDPLPCKLDLELASTMLSHVRRNI